MSRYENAELGIYAGVGEYGIPQIEPVKVIPGITRWIEFDYCQRLRKDRKDRRTLGVHFFEPDYKFERAWTCPDRYGEMLQEFGCCMSPDFSMFMDFPKALSVYNHYRKHFLARYWHEMYNISVVPTIGWCGKDSYDWCFDGEPEGSIVAVSNVGCAINKEAKSLFAEGYKEMLIRLHPIKVLFFTRNFEEYPGPVQYIKWDIHKGDQLNG